MIFKVIKNKKLSSSSANNKITLRTDYDWVRSRDDYHTHKRRREAILHAHPEIRNLMVFDPWFKWHALAVFTVQMCSYVAISYYISPNNYLLLAVLAYLIGGPLNQSLITSLHDISHKQAFGYGRPMANSLFGILVNLPIGAPIFASFNANHPLHHRYLGKRLDADIPTEWEGRWFNTPVRKVFWLTFMSLFYAIRPFIVTPKPLVPMEIIGFVIQLVFDILIYHYLGFGVLFYMLFGSFISFGIHPVSVHFITEHGVFFFEDDYLNKLGKNLKHKQQKLAEKLFVPDTFSYYGMMNWLTFNIGYHVEHHDFPSIPSSLLPRVRKLAPEFYEPLCFHTSALKVLIKFITDPRINPFSRIKRIESNIEDAVMVKNEEEQESKQIFQKLETKKAKKEKDENLLFETQPLSSSKENHDNLDNLNMVLSKDPAIRQNYLFYY